MVDADYTEPRAIAPRSTIQRYFEIPIVIIALFAGAAFLWLGILIVLTMNDYVTRPPDIRQQISHPLPQPALQRSSAEKNED